MDRDFLHSALKWVSYNRYTVLGFAIVIAIVVFSYGCQSTTTYDGEVVNRSQLEQRVIVDMADIEREQAALDSRRETLLHLGAIAEADLDTQDEQRQSIINGVGDLAVGIATGTVNPAQAITGVLGLAGIFGGGGAILTGRRKDRVIEKLKNGHGDPDGGSG